MERNQLARRQVAAMRQSLFDQGYLDEQFVQLEELQDDANPNFVEEIVTLYYRDSARLISNIEQTLAPTADSEIYKKLDPSVRDACESRAIMKSYMERGSDSTNPEKFLAYLAPGPGELSKDMYDEREDISYSWVREYHWDVRGEDADDPTTYLVSFDKEEAHYLPLPRKLVLRKKRAKEGKSGDEVEQFLTPSSVTVRKRPAVAALELKDDGGYGNTKGISSSVKRGGSRRLHRVAQEPDNYQYSEAEDEMSD